MSPARTRAPVSSRAGDTHPGITVRGCSGQDWPTIRRVDELAFGYTWADDPSADEDKAVFEVDRTLLAMVHNEPAGIASAYTMRVSVPGQRDGLPPVRCAGVTWVGVIPTHRRRGVLTALMSAQLEQIHSAGEPVAMLWASEPGIYPRFGYGQASSYLALTVEQGHAALAGPHDPTLQARIVPAPDARSAVSQVYEQASGHRAGFPVRTDPWWRRTIADPPARRAGASDLRALLVGDESTTRAYALWNQTEHWEHGSAQGRLEVREALATDAAASALLWRTLLSIDLVSTVSVRRVPPDDPLLAQLTDLRRARPELRDGVFVRLVDVAAALTCRAYTSSWEGVVQISDATCPWNEGRWRLRLGRTHTSVERTELPADITMGVSELGAAFLGGVSLQARAAAGHLTEMTAGAVVGLSAAMRHEPAPFCPFVF